MLLKSDNYINRFSKFDNYFNEFQNLVIILTDFKIR